MARAAFRRRLSWQTGTVVNLVAETPQARTVVLKVPGWRGHRAGQHVDIRLTGADGHQAERSYAIASAPRDAYLELTVERIPRGEVSAYLVNELRRGDVLELRGPIGGYFVWHQALGGPLLLIADGAGIVPLRSMLRHHRMIHSDVPVRVLYSVRDPDRLIYRKEIMRLATSDEVDVSLTFTHTTPPRWNGYNRDIDQQMLTEVSWPPADHQLAYVCGPRTFVDTTASLLVAARHAPERIRTERFDTRDATRTR